MSDDQRASATVVWEDGYGWHYVDDEYPEEGACGPFDSWEEAAAHAREGEYQVTVRLELEEVPCIYLSLCDEEGVLEGSEELAVPWDAEHWARHPEGYLMNRKELVFPPCTGNEVISRIGLGVCPRQPLDTFPIPPRHPSGQDLCVFKISVSEHHVLMAETLFGVKLDPLPFHQPVETTMNEADTVTVRTHLGALTAPRGFGAAYKREAARQAELVARGEPGKIISGLQMVLRLVGFDASTEVVADWDLQRRVEVSVYAAYEHLSASDNPVRRHPRPAWLPEPWRGPPDERFLGGSNLPTPLAAGQG